MLSMTFWPPDLYSNFFLGLDKMCSGGCQMPFPVEGYQRAGAPMASPTGADENVCANQQVFNQALYDAVKYNQKEELKKERPWMYVYVILWMVFFVWAIVLAMRAPAGHERIEHLVFAMVFSPVYVLAYYLGLMGNMSDKVGFGMCGGGDYGHEM